MSIEANPTLDEIVREGLAKAGELNPSSTLIARTKSAWIKEIKNDLFKDIKQPKFLQITSHGVAVKGQSRYSMPSDYSNDLTLVLLDGDIRGTAANGSTSDITLGADPALSYDRIIGHDILITDGIGKGSLAQIIDFDPATRQTTISPAFTEAPAPGSLYLIIDVEHEVTGDAVWNADRGKYVSLARPHKFYTTGDDLSGEFIFNYPPDKAYGLRLRYYANVMKLDIDSPMMSNLYLRWRNMWIKGVTAKHLSDNDDDRAVEKTTEYDNEAAAILASEGYGVDIHKLNQVVTDYY